MYYHLVTLGCQMNKSDSERVRSVLDGLGYAWTGREEEANMLGVLACSVRQKSIDKVYSRISRWNKWKSKKNLVTFVSGCMLPEDKNKFLKLFDLVFTMDELPELGDMIRQYGIVTPVGHKSVHAKAVLSKSAAGQLSIPAAGQLSAFQPFDHKDNSQPASKKIQRPEMTRFWDVTPSYQSAFEAFIPIQNGCDKFCTFCAVPYTRGREASRPSAEILEEVSTLVDRGYRSITLLGQNVNSYGKDKKGSELTFPELLIRIGQLGEQSRKEFWVYFTSPHPRDMTDEVIDVIARYPVLAKQLHLPLQSGDDRILMKMNRNHNVERYMAIIEKIRKDLPEATIFTDIIVGFTGETEQHFLSTHRIMDEVQFNMAYIALYSPRPGATSARWEDDIPQDVKKERLHRLTAVLKKHAAAYNRRLVGKRVRMLVTGTDRKTGYLSGHTEGKIIARFPSKDASLIGQFVTVKVSSSADFAVEGALTKSKEPATP